MFHLTSPGPTLAMSERDHAKENEDVESISTSSLSPDKVLPKRSEGSHVIPVRLVCIRSCRLGRSASSPPHFYCDNLPIQLESPSNPITRFSDQEDREKVASDHPTSRVTRPQPCKGSRRRAISEGNDPASGGELNKRLQANARERMRTLKINEAMQKLQIRVPWLRS